MAVDTATELLFLDTFKHQSAEVMRWGRWGLPFPSSSIFPGPPRAAAVVGHGAGLGRAGLE